MPIELRTLISNIEPARTVLLFGAGSSMPSNTPGVARLQAHFEKVFGVKAGDYTLAEQSGIIEQTTHHRRGLIEALRSQFKGLRPTGALLNLPLYNWKSIFTTNYDELIEDCYERRERPLVAYTTNFDFGVRLEPDAIQLFKLHGTIGKDVAFGDNSRLIITEADYDLTEEYRQTLFDRLKAELAGSHLLIIGHSLADPDIRSVVTRALSLNAKAGAGGRISLLMYTADEGRTALLESRGIDVCVGSIDDFFAGLVGHIVTEPPVPLASGDPLDLVTALRPSTEDVAHSLATSIAEVSRMYNGWPASYSDINAGLTFRRNVADEIEQQLLSTEHFISVVLLGPSGVGKTTAARQAMMGLVAKGFFAWEHKPDQGLLAPKWREVARYLSKQDARGVLLIDDAHRELSELNDLVDFLVSDKDRSLKLIIVSTNHQWRPRVKTPNVYKEGKEYLLSRVQGNEIDRLLILIEGNAELRSLVESGFAGFSRSERRRRLIERCDADMFVCLKNIFSSDKLDDIILREYADLNGPLREVYRAIAAMESAGVHVHRQLVIRLLGIPAAAIGSVLTGLADIIHEQTVNEREGIYAWRGRHKVIMDIVAEHKYYDTSKRFDLFAKVIDAISPTYDIEIRTIRELCNTESGIATIGDKHEQNVLLRKMMSIAPGERVPRHRLIRNLIDLNQFDRADTEIRVFQNDFGLDGPAVRYKINLATARATRSPGLLHEDRIVLINKAYEIAAAAASRYKMNKAILGAYCEVGVETAKLTGRSDIFDIAIAELKEAEDRIGDPDISRMINRFERRMGTVAMEPEDLAEPELPDD